MSQPICACAVMPPRRESAVVRLASTYTWYVDEVIDDTIIDPDCYFHGDRGTMVARVPR